MNICFSNKFQRDCIRMEKRGKDLAKIQQLVELLVNNQALPVSYRDHILSGRHKYVHDVHIAPDWIVLYEVKSETINFIRTGSHSDLNL